MGGRRAPEDGGRKTETRLGGGLCRSPNVGHTPQMTLNNISKVRKLGIASNILSNVSVKSNIEKDPLIEDAWRVSLTRCTFAGSGALSTSLENPRVERILTPDRIV
jgi:hypothetical protein